MFLTVVATCTVIKPTRALLMWATPLPKADINSCPYCFSSTLLGANVAVPMPDSFNASSIVLSPLLRLSYIVIASFLPCLLKLLTLPIRLAASETWCANRGAKSDTSSPYLSIILFRSALFKTLWLSTPPSKDLTKREVKRSAPFSMPTESPITSSISEANAAMFFISIWSMFVVSFLETSAPFSNASGIVSLRGSLAWDFFVIFTAALPTSITLSTLYPFPNTSDTYSSNSSGLKPFWYVPILVITDIGSLPNTPLTGLALSPNTSPPLVDITASPLGFNILPISFTISLRVSGFTTFNTFRFVILS